MEKNNVQLIKKYCISTLSYHGMDHRHNDAIVTLDSIIMGIHSFPADISKYFEIILEKSDTVPTVPISSQ